MKIRCTGPVEQEKDQTQVGEVYSLRNPKDSEDFTYYLRTQGGFVALTSGAVIDYLDAKVNGWFHEPNAVLVIE